MDVAGQLDADPVRLADHGVARRRAEHRSNGARAFSFKRHLPQSLNRRILGYGLNLFDADPWNSQFKDKRILAAPIQTKRREIRVTKYEDTYKDNFLDMTHTLAVESGLKGSYGDFSGSVTSKYTRTDRKIEKRISHSTHLYDLSLASSPSELKGKLEPKFKSDLETMPTGELLDLYGSHLVHKIKMGGRAEYFCQTADLASMTEEEFKATAQAKYKSLGGKVQSDTSYGTVDKKKNDW
jgi:hypothetical protein